MDAAAMLFPFNAPLLSLAKILGHRGSPTVKAQRGARDRESEIERAKAQSRKGGKLAVRWG